jgi:PiT family inorganic phosphate transporter
MPPLTWPFVVFLAAGLFFAYLNGVTDSANIVAPLITARAFPRRRALLVTAIAAMAAPFIFGVAVAEAFGAGVLLPGGVTLPVVLAGTVSALIWRLLTLWWGIPASNSHAMVGGLLGAGLAGAGVAGLNGTGLLKVILALFVSPMFGLGMGFLITRLMYFLAQWASPRINQTFRRGQVLTAVVLALSWGANDAQKTIGLLALGAAAAQSQPFTVEPWAIVASMGAVAAGTLFSGSRLLRTLGARFYRIRPVNGLAAQLASAGVIFGAAAIGGPVSTTQVVSTAIMGAGAAERISKVRWGLAGDILIAWILTIPATALIGAVLAWLLTLLLP